MTERRAYAHSFGHPAFLTAALVFSVTCLVILLRVRIADALTTDFLRVLVPLSLQMLLSLLATYLERSLSPRQLASFSYTMYALRPRSSRFFLPRRCSLHSPASSSAGCRRAKSRNGQEHHPAPAHHPLLLISIWAILGKSRGDWIKALDETMKYHFSAPPPSVIHAVVALFFIKQAST